MKFHKINGMLGEDEMKKIRLNMDRKMAYDCIEDTDFSDYMKSHVEPYLNKLKTFGLYERENEKPLYFEGYMLEKAEGTVVVAHGFGESIQKYKEVIYYFLTEHYNVFLLDHRGHGKSVRETGNSDFSLTHIDNFMDYIEDFRGFIEEIVVSMVGTDFPFYIYAHSMGGAIAARYLQMYPGRIKKAVLTAPMLDLYMTMPQIQAQAISYYMVKVGRGKDYIAGHKPFCGTENFKESSSSSRERYEYYFRKKVADQELQNNAGSYSWLYESIKIIKKIQREKRKIQIPICIFTAEKDDLVTREGQVALAKRTPDSQLVLIPGSKHEIYMAPAGIQRQYWRYIFSFLKEKQK